MSARSHRTVRPTRIGFGTSVARAPRAGRTDRCMSTQVFALAGIEAWPIDFRTPLAWLGLAFGLVLVVGLAWCALASLRRRWTGHFVRCPETGSSARLPAPPDTAHRCPIRVQSIVTSRLATHR